MSDEPETPPEGEEELLLTEEVEAPETPEVEEPAAEDEEEEVFAFGDEPEPSEPETPTIKQMRQKISEVLKENAELKRRASPEPTIEVGEKPTLAGCEYDEDAYETALDQYKERLRLADEQKNAGQKAAEREREAWEAELNKVNEEKAKLNRADVEDAFQTVRDTLTTAQQALLVQTADEGNRAKLIYALAKHPAQLEALANINVTDAITVAKFAKMVGNLEGKLKVVKRRSAPAPDTPETPSAKAAPTPNAHQKQLDKMEAEWERTGGDRTKIQQFKRQHGLK